MRSLKLQPAAIGVHWKRRVPEHASAKQVRKTTFVSPVVRTNGGLNILTNRAPQKYCPSLLYHDAHQEKSYRDFDQDHTQHDQQAVCKQPSEVWLVHPWLHPLEVMAHAIRGFTTHADECADRHQRRQNHRKVVGPDEMKHACSHI
jgi:hypothetical protein